MSFSKFKRWSTEGYQVPPSLAESRDLDPLNIRLLKLEPDQLARLPEITSPLILVPSTRTFHPEGLYSTEIFGTKGSIERMDNFAYINLKMNIIQPRFYKAMVAARSLYEDIIAGKAYALFNEDTLDFDQTTLDKGRTGYNFFIEYFDRLEIPETGSDTRDLLIKQKNKYANKLLIDKLIVLPAGMRDVEVNEEGRIEEENEINGFYWSILSLSKTIPEGVYDYHPESLDNLRYRIQRKVQELYEYLFDSTFGGKRKFALGRWGYRAIRYGSRNVLGTVVNNLTELHSPDSIKPTQSTIGLYQFMKMIGPLANYHITQYLKEHIVQGNHVPFNLIDPKTLRTRAVTIPPEVYDYYLSKEGVDRFIDRFKIESLRHHPFEIQGYYAYLIYVDDESFMRLTSIDDLPPGLNASKVRPMTLGEFIYFAMYMASTKVPRTNTRFPVANLGGAYPSLIHLKTTMEGLSRFERNRDGEITQMRYPNLPILGMRFYDMDAPHTSHLAAQGADHDGDMEGSEALLTEESTTEVHELLQKASFYISPRGGATYSFSNNIAELVMKHVMTLPEKTNA